MFFKGCYFLVFQGGLVIAWFFKIKQGTFTWISSSKANQMIFHATIENSCPLYANTTCTKASNYLP